MKKYLKLISLVVCAAMMLSALTALAGISVSASVVSVTGTSTITSENIYLGGVDTGVTYTQMKLTAGTKYAPSSAGVVNVIEIGSNSSARFQVINHGAYNWKSSTVGAAAVAYNDSHNSTVLAATNACPWLMGTSDYDADHVSATGPSVKIGGAGIPMGFVMIDGEIWNTGWFSDENKMDNKYYTDWTVSGQKAFFVLNDGTYQITATPTLSINIANVSNGRKATGDAINRTPAPNSILLYNKRVYSESLAYADAYEIYLECDSSEFRLGQTITGTVTAVYENKDVTYTNNDWKETRPAIGENTVVISARGSSIAELSAGNYEVGHTVTINLSTRSAAAKKADQIIGGFFSLVENGTKTGEPNNSSQYPTSIVGIREDGSAIMINVTTQKDSAYQGCQGKYLPDLCVELGCVDAFMFDGGGSATCLTLEEGVYVRRNGCSDGQPRVVGNSLAIVFDGAKTTASYARSSGIKFIDGIANNTPTTFVDETATNAPTETPTEPTTEPEGEVVTEAPDIQAAAVSNYRYAGNIDFINGVGPNGSMTPYAGVFAIRNSKSESLSIPVISGISAAGNHSLSITGWALVNGGQSGHYWSVDGNNWYECSASEPVDMSNYADILDTATQLAELTSTDNCEANSKFKNISADLTPWAGRTIPTVYFAVKAAVGTGDKLLTILQINNVSVPVHECQPGAAPTCTEPQACVTCGKVYLPPLGHNWPEKSCTEDWTCTRCGLIAEYQNGHDFSSAFSHNANEHWHTCYDCGVASEHEAHTFEDSVCTVCGYECEHDTTDKIPAVNAGCMDTGLSEGEVCSACGITVTEQQTLPALGHNWQIQYDDNNHWYACTRCDETKDSAPHDIVGGQCDCGYGCRHTQTETIPAAPATCTEKGLTEGKICKICGEITVEQTETDMIPHNEVTVNGIAATCTEKGLTDGKKCSVCGKITVEQTETDMIPHTEVTVDGIAATCTEKGLTDGKKCSVCGKITVEQTETDMIPHNKVAIGEAKLATCVENGITAGVKCSVCGQIFEAQETIVATGHSYDNDLDAECNSCGEIRELATEKPTEAPTTAPTETPTTAPTEAPTTAPTEAPTTAPTEAPTTAPTEAPTTAPTDQPTEAPTEAPTTAPTDQPTEAPTENEPSQPTSNPTDSPSDAPGGNDGEKHKRSCGSTLGFGVIAMISSIALAGYTLIKKKED